MSLITRCPACRTMFKVVPDQLRISEGWVRCGKCDEIFDAQANLQEGVEQSQADEPSTVFQSELEAAQAAEPAALHSERIATPEAHGRMEPVMAPALADDAVLLPEGSAYGVAESPALASDPESAPPATAPAPAAKPRSDPELSFMRSARRPSRWHRPLVRVTLSLLCLVLGLALALQLLVQERDRIVAHEPGLRPLVEEVCLHMGCAVQPLRQIESVVIDSSAFSKIKGDLYRLSLTLKNNAPIDLAMPAVELALTDTLDHALIRRVLQAEDLGVSDGVIAAASETQTTLLLTVKANGSGERIAGYRLLAFYP